MPDDCSTTVPACDHFRGMAVDAATDLSDDDLMARFAAGDSYAARQLAIRHTPRVLSVSYRVLGDYSEAEDVAQEAMLRLWQMAGDWRPGVARVSTWLFRVATNLSLDRLRQRRRRLRHFSGEDRSNTANDVNEIEDNSTGAEQKLLETDRANALHAALANLPERSRAAVILRHIEQLSNPEIAEILNTSVEAVESLTARGRRSLAKQLLEQREEIGLS